MKLYKRDIWRNTQPADMGSESCPFCETHFDASYEIYQTKHWRVLHNKFPVLWLREHIMATPKMHLRLAYEIPSEVMAEYPLIEKFVYDFFDGASYFTFMRESLQNRSLEHIHYHFLPGKLNYTHLEYILKDQGFTDQLASD